jgi:hypothetical protein
VENTFTGDFARVIAVNAHSLELSNVTLGGNFSAPSPDIFTDETHGYSIYRQWDQSTPSDPTGVFYEYDVDWNMGISSGAGVTVYDSIRTGTVDDIGAASSLDLFDNLADFLAATAVAIGDIVVNMANFISPLNPNVATVAAVGYRHALDLDNPIFNDGNTYEILRVPSSLAVDQSHIVDSGQATAGTGGTALYNTAANPGWAGLEGHVVYNITDDDYAVVTRVDSNTQLTLSRDAQLGMGDRFLILHARGVLYVWQEATGVYGRVMTMDESPAVELRPRFSIAAGATTPMALADDRGNALIAYRDSSGQLQMTTRNGAGDDLWTTAVDAQNT